MKVYGLLNSSIQTIADDTYVPQYNEVLMNSERPTGEHVASASGEWEIPLSNLKINKLNALGQEFAKRRDSVRFVDGLGFDCGHEDIGNFMASFTPLLVNKTGTTLYKVWINETTKGVVELNYTQMQKIYDEVRTSQLQDYAWYGNKKAEIKACTTIADLEKIIYE